MPRTVGGPWKLGVTPEMRFAAKVVPGDNGCLDWVGAKSKAGYGRLGVDGSVVYVHRWVYERANGPIPVGMFVCHRCDRPACCALEHLFLGTHADNMADMKAKGRTNKTIETRMEDHHAAKITEAIAVEVRQLEEQGFRQCDIAEQFGVSRSLISRVVLNKTWKGAQA